MCACMVSLVIERKGMDMAYVCLALASLPGTHTTVAVQRPAEFLLMKISIMETERRGEEKRTRKRTVGKERKGNLRKGEVRRGGEEN